MTSHTEDIRTESLIHKKWNTVVSHNSKYPGGILVTGANSFIGVHVVKKLRETQPGKIHLLLRAPSIGEAIGKMIQAYSQWGLEDFNPVDFCIHLGDVTMNRMNLNAKEFKMVKSETGTVIHLAMTPLYHLPYHHFQRVWIPELERMISFCADPESPKSLHYASSFNASFFQTDQDFKALNTNAWQSGYAGFKWVAGQAIRNAMDQGLKGCIYDIPLVLGSEKNGLCPNHYSIWHILDIFLKTGYYFPFSFRVIPVDILAEIIVLKILKENHEGLIRPLLDEPVTDSLLSRTAAHLLGLKEADIQTVKDACVNKLRFDFMIPVNFYELLEKVNHLPAKFPAGFNPANLPTTLSVFMSNLNRVISRKHETVI